MRASKTSGKPTAKKAEEKGSIDVDAGLNMKVVRVGNTKTRNPRKGYKCSPNRGR